MLDQLARLTAGAVDLRLPGPAPRPGANWPVGHSTGGGAIALVCSRDPRCKAGLGHGRLAVPVPKTVIPGPLRQPFLFMRSEIWASAKNQARLEEIHSQLAGLGYRLTIMGTRHFDFTPMPLFSPLAAQLGLKGPLEVGAPCRSSPTTCWPSSIRTSRASPRGCWIACRRLPRSSFERR